MGSFYETITEAVNDVVDHGFDSQKRIDDWLVKIRVAALGSLVSETTIETEVSATLRGIYQRMVVKGNIIERHQGLTPFNLNMVKPKLRNELDRRIMANASLIRLNRDAAIDTTLRRFAGWSTSIPNGGSKAVDKPEIKQNIRKALSQLPFEERRVAIDQGHKFISSLNAIIADDRQALAAIWKSKWRRPGYNYREDHKERDDLYYAIRGNWAIEKGLMKVGPAGYSDKITQPAEEPYCSCTWQYIYNLNSLPIEMLTAKGRMALKEALVL